MSYRYSTGSSSDSSSRNYTSSRHGSSSRRSPSPKREQPRDPKLLPDAFGRGDAPKVPDDDTNILQRMKTHYQNSPLSDLYECIKGEKKVKIWTRNFKEVRGVMTGYLIAFDKHWNIVLKDVDEVFLKPKKCKTPFLREIAPNETFPDIPAKLPRQKKGGAQPEPVKPAKGVEGKKRKTRRKKAKSVSSKRSIAKFIH